MDNKENLIDKRVMKDLVIEDYIGSGGFDDVYRHIVFFKIVSFTAR